MASENIVERIKKLLRLGADARGNAHEAERAMALAFELAERHRIDVESLHLDEDTARVVHEQWHTGLRFDRVRRGVFGILQTFFHVTVCRRGAEMLVIGRTQDVAIARYVHDFLLRTARECLRVWEGCEKADRRRVTLNKRASYLTGFFWGISGKLAASRETMPLTDNQRAIVLTEKAAREAVLNDLVPQRETLKALPARRNLDALGAGLRDGEKTNIHQPLGGATGGVLLLQ